MQSELHIGRPFTGNGNFSFTDAAEGEKRGLGCVFEQKWRFAMWEDNFIRNCHPSIEYLELYAIMVAVELWARYLQNRRVIIF